MGRDGRTDDDLVSRVRVRRPGRARDHVPVASGITLFPLEPGRSELAVA